MKLAFRIVLVLTLLPPALAIAGLLLSNLAGCSGMAHIEHCDTASLFSTVAFLIAFFWISVFTVPVGVILLIVIGLARHFTARRRAG